MTPSSSKSTGKRWNLFHDSEGDFIGGPVVTDNGIQVMPVSEHQEICEELRSEYTKLWDAAQAVVRAQKGSDLRKGIAMNALLDVLEGEHR